MKGNSKDPSGFGMYSKLGQSLTEQYNIFLKKDEIMEDKRRSFKISHSIVAFIL